MLYFWLQHLVKRKEEEAKLKPVPKVFPANYENFDSIDTHKWEYQLYRFDGNDCNIRKENVLINKSILSLKTEVNTDASLPKKYNGGEIADKQFYLYGYYTVRMRSNLCVGMVSAFFL